jgi:hypothetical protein
MKEYLKKFWMVEFFVSILHCIECKTTPLFIGDEKAVKKYYKKLTGENIRLDNPRTFCEKINWYKLNSKDPLMEQCADKVGVRDYVKTKGYEECLNEIYGVYQNVSDINVSELPDRFVLKATHGSHMNIIVKDKSHMSWIKEKLMMKTWLHQDIAWGGREWVYKNLPKRIVAEKYLEDENGELRDYKFFCFHGTPEYMEYDIGRFSGKPYRNFYDMNLMQLDFSDGTESIREEEPLPKNQFEKMKKIAADLSADFQQVRIDLYLVDNHIYFGEMTFFDGGGSTIFKPDMWNEKFSENWHVSLS